MFLHRTQGGEGLCLRWRARPLPLSQARPCTLADLISEFLWILKPKLFDVFENLCLERADLDHGRCPRGGAAADCVASARRHLAPDPGLQQHRSLRRSTHSSSLVLVDGGGREGGGARHAPRGIQLLRVTWLVLGGCAHAPSDAQIAVLRWGFESADGTYRSISRGLRRKMERVKKLLSYVDGSGPRITRVYAERDLDSALRPEHQRRMTLQCFLFILFVFVWQRF